MPIIQPLNTQSKSGELTTQQLLQLADLNGGAVSEVANELTHPERSFGATISDGFKKSFGVFVDVLGTPNNIVAGMLSPDQTIGEAMKKNTSVSDVLLGDKPKDLTMAGKFGSFTGRMAIDVLFDPLTYLTFGTGRGILGIRKGAEIYAGEKAAALKGIQKGDTLVLNEPGEKLLDSYVTAQQNGLRNTFLKNTEQKMYKEELTKYGLTKATQVEVTRTVSAKVAERMKVLEDTLTDSMVAETFGSKLSRTEAAKIMTRLFENNPALMETYLDKGGIKMFGTTLLEGQRISRTIKAIPGFNEFDRVTKPYRNVAASLFSKNYTVNGRKPQMIIDIENKAKNLAESRNNALLQRLPAVYSKLNISSNEADFITSAIEHNLMPHDKKAADIWKIANGIEPEDPIIRDEVWQAMGFINGAKRDTMKMLREAGIPVSDLNNYMKHIVTKNQVTPKFYRKSANQEAKSQIEAKYITLVDENGVRFPAAFDAKPNKEGFVSGKVNKGNGVFEQRKYKVIRTETEIKAIKELSISKGKEIRSAFDALQKEMETAKATLKGNLSENIAAIVTKRIANIKELTPKEKKELADVFTEYIDDDAVNKLVTTRLMSAYDKGVKVTGGAVSDPDFKRIIKEAIDKDKSAQEISAALKSSIKADKSPALVQGVKNANKKAPTGKVDAELKKIADEIRKQTTAGRAAILKDGIDEDAIKGILTKLLDNFTDNPTGMSRAIDKIVSSSQGATDLSNDFHDVMRAMEMDIADVTANSGKFVDQQSGKVLAPVRIYIEEAREFGINFEENSLLATLAGSYEAIKVSSARYFTDDIARSFGKAKSEAPEDWVPVSMSGLSDTKGGLGGHMMNKKGEELVFPPNIAEAIEGYSRAITGDEASTEAMKYYDKLQNYFKASVTAVFPAFHGRNAISNVMQMFSMLGAEALNPAMHVKAGQLHTMETTFKKMQLDMDLGKIKGQEFSDFLQKKMFTDGSGYQWSYGELRSVIHDNMMAFHPRNLGQVDQTMLAKDQLTELKHKMFPSSKLDKMYYGKLQKVNPFTTKNIAIEKGFQVGQMIEDHSKMVTFLSYLKQTGDVQQAAKMTQEVLFDYTNLSEFERRFLRRIMPFYTFTRKNMELQVKTLFKTPGRTAGLLRSVTTIGDVFGEDKLTEEEKAKLPEWMQKGIHAVTKRENSHITILDSMGTPIEQTLSNLDPHTLLSMTSPLIKVPLEKLSGYSFFYGRPISEVTNAAAFKSAPAAMKEYIGFTEVKGKNRNTGEEFTYYTALRPERMHTILSLPPTSRAWSQLRSLQAADVSTQNKIMGALIGVKATTYDLDIEGQRREKEQRKELEALLQKAGVGYTFNRFVVPKEEE